MILQNYYSLFIVVVVVIYLTFSVHLWYHFSVARKHGNQEVLSSP